MKEKKYQAKLFGYFPSTGKKKKYPTMEDGSVALSAGRELSADDRAVSSSIVGVQNNVACAEQSSSKSGRHDGLLVTACVGAFNSVNGKKKNNVALVHLYVLIDQTKSKYQWGLYFARPAIVSKQCTGIGVLKAIDGGIACNACKDLCTKKSCSNPGISFLVDWSISINKCIERSQERL